MRQQAYEAIAAMCTEQVVPLCASRRQASRFLLVIPVPPPTPLPFSPLIFHPSLRFQTALVTHCAAWRWGPCGLAAQPSQEKLVATQEK